MLEHLPGQDESTDDLRPSKEGVPDNNVESDRTTSMIQGGSQGAPGVEEVRKRTRKESSRGSNVTNPAENSGAHHLRWINYSSEYYSPGSSREAVYEGRGDPIRITRWINESQDGPRHISSEPPASPSGSLEVLPPSTPIVLPAIHLLLEETFDTTDMMNVKLSPILGRRTD